MISEKNIPGCPLTDLLLIGAQTQNFTDSAGPAARQGGYTPMGGNGHDTMERTGGDGPVAVGEDRGAHPLYPVTAVRNRKYQRKIEALKITDQ